MTCCWCSVRCAVGVLSPYVISFSAAISASDKGGQWHEALLVFYEIDEQEESESEEERASYARIQ
eukprot:12316122-Karenia_brevis.AAC.1